MAEKVVVLEDDNLTRLTLVATLKQCGLDVVASTDKVSETIALAEKYNPSIALLDLHLGEGPNGIDAARALRRHNPQIGIVFLTSLEDPRLLKAKNLVMPLRAQYLTKQSVSEVGIILKALKNSLKSHVNSNHQNMSGIGKLTDTQIETLKLVAEGLTNAEIARRRFVTEKSVEVTIARVAKALEIEHTSTNNQRVHVARIYFRAIGVLHDR